MGVARILLFMLGNGGLFFMGVEGADRSLDASSLVSSISSWKETDFLDTFDFPMAVDVGMPVFSIVVTGVHSSWIKFWQRNTD